MPRLFSGISLPVSVRSELLRLRGGLHHVKWVEPEDLHITLRFVGDVDDVVADEFARRLARISFNSFSVTLDGVGAFGGGRPHSVYAAIVSSPELTALQHAHEMAAQASGLAPESRKFTPHVTVGRVRGSKPTEIAKYLQQFGAFLSTPIAVDETCLFSARASTGGGPYAVEECFTANDVLGMDHDTEFAADDD